MCNASSRIGVPPASPSLLSLTMAEVHYISLANAKQGGDGVCIIDRVSAVDLGVGRKERTPIKSKCVNIDVQHFHFRRHSSHRARGCTG